MSEEILKLIKDKEVQFVDLRFNDLRGKMQHVTFDVSMIDKDIFTEGTMFDGSSISGWKAINESDMVMRPDPKGAHIDPFYQQTTLAMFCDILEPGTLQPYSRCPRGIAKRAEAYVKSSGAGDVAYVGPEAEFFVFDDVRWSTDPHNTGYSFDSTELPSNDEMLDWKSTEPTRYCWPSSILKVTRNPRRSGSYSVSAATIWTSA